MKLGVPVRSSEYQYEAGSNMQLGVPSYMEEGSESPENRPPLVRVVRGANMTSGVPIYS